MVAWHDWCHDGAPPPPSPPLPPPPPPTAPDDDREHHAARPCPPQGVELRLEPRDLPPQLEHLLRAPARSGRRCWLRHVRCAVRRRTARRALRRRALRPAGDYHARLHASRGCGTRGRGCSPRGDREGVAGVADSSGGNPEAVTPAELLVRGACRGPAEAAATPVAAEQAGLLAGTGGRPRPGWRRIHSLWLGALWLEALKLRALSPVALRATATTAAATAAATTAATAATSARALARCGGGRLRASPVGAGTSERKREGFSGKVAQRRRRRR